MKSLREGDEKGLASRKEQGGEGKKQRGRKGNNSEKVCRQFFFIKGQQGREKFALLLPAAPESRKRSKKTSLLLLLLLLRHLCSSSPSLFLLAHFSRPLLSLQTFPCCPRYNTSAVVQNEVREGGERDPDFAKSERNSREGRGESRKTILLRARKTISRRVSIFFLCLLFWEGLVMVAAPIRQPGSSRSGVRRNERLVTHYKSEGENAEV